MIRSEAEYQEAARRLSEQDKRLNEQQTKLGETGLQPAEVKRVMDPLGSLQHQLAEEVEAYERLKRGEFGELRGLADLGQLLIAARIYRGLSQRELAQRLGVHESQVSRDERHEYHQVALQRAARLLDALEVDLHSQALPRCDEALAKAG